MKKIKKIVFAGTLLTDVAIPTAALAAEVGGGEWNYGVGATLTYGYSNYQHNSKKHSASIENNGTVRREEQNAKTWAKVSITKIPPTGMNYYWGVS